MKTILTSGKVFADKQRAATVLFKVLRRLDLIDDATYYLADGLFFDRLWKTYVAKLNE